MRRGNLLSHSSFVNGSFVSDVEENEIFFFTLLLLMPDSRLLILDVWKYALRCAKIMQLIIVSLPRMNKVVFRVKFETRIQSMNGQKCCFPLHKIACYI